MTETLPDNEFEKGFNLFLAQKYDEGLKILKPLSKKGHAKASFQLGNLYYMVSERHANNRKAFKYYKRAAIAGHREAQGSLGLL